MRKKRKRCSEAELDRIISEYGDQVLRFCSLYLKGDCYLAEDAAQETFLVVYRKYGDLHDKFSEFAWIIQIAKNQCRNILRKKYLHIEILCEMVEKREQKEEGKKKSLVDEIQKLTWREREAVVMYYYQELSVKEIAEILKVREPTVRQRIKRGLDKLKMVLESEGLYGKDMEQEVKFL